jgi:hypothetical protein
MGDTGSIRKRPQCQLHANDSTSWPAHSLRRHSQFDQKPEAGAIVRDKVHAKVGLSTAVGQQLLRDCNNLIFARTQIFWD